jgi:bisphosphoglycerate-independent phosphoglycerate mutase (AlkP superfamily)
LKVLEVKMKKNPVMLMILDGFGISEKKQGNAVKSAYKPNIDSYLMQCGAAGRPDGKF